MGIHLQCYKDMRSKSNLDNIDFHLSVAAQAIAINGTTEDLKEVVAEYKRELNATKKIAL